jgi:stearoyl-CoA desaturase (delta-9 desaturase)
MFKSIHMIIIVIVAAILAGYFLVTGAHPLWWAAALGMNFLSGCLGITVTFHRYLSHQSFEFRWPWMEKFFSLLGLLGGTGSAIGWVALHKAHHAYVDTDRDPHGPPRGWRNFYPDYDTHLRYRFAKHLIKDPFHWFLHKNGAWIIGAYLLALYVFGGLEALAFLGLIPQVITGGVSSVCNWFTHFHGYRTYDTDDNSRNVWWLAIPTWGESWHNNHHANIGDYSFRNKWWEIDISAMVIYLVKKR